ncbi:MAG: aminoacyl-tRNA hydrolase [Candidatus Omnitrophota bacterium]
MVNDYLLVGLGNPGKEYAATRHNFGFLVVSHFADLYQIKFVKSAKYHGMIGCGTIEGKRVHLLLPLTYMNASGVAVKAFVQAQEIALGHVLVLCDDFHLDFGEIRIRPQGSSGGHNGLTSVVQEIGSEDVARLRLGIGAPREKSQTIDFVLSDFRINEKKRLQEIISEATDCCNVFLMSGISQAMTRFNKRSKKEEEK